jgi:hypothetical protein
MLQGQYFCPVAASALENSSKLGVTSLSGKTGVILEIFFLAHCRQSGSSLVLAGRRQSRFSEYNYLT